ncbi:MAG: hypothetical protein ACI4D8_04530 [Wujia sp.]
MISPIIAATGSMPAATVQQNSDAQSVLHTQIASDKVREEERQIRESVVQKDEAVFYQPHHDAKEEGRNKYANLYSGKKKQPGQSDVKEERNGDNRVNFDIKI